MPSKEVTVGGKESGALKLDGAVCPRKEELKLWVHWATGTRLGQTLDLPEKGDLGTLRKGCVAEFTVQYSGQ